MGMGESLFAVFNRGVFYLVQRRGDLLKKEGEQPEERLKVGALCRHKGTTRWEVGETPKKRKTLLGRQGLLAKTLVMGTQKERGK